MTSAKIETANNLAPSVSITPGGPVSGSIRPPGSKSLTNRALICAAMATGESRITGALASEDTEVMIESLRRIGVEAQIQDGGRTVLFTQQNQSSSAGATDHPTELYIANSGTSIRFLTATLSALGGHYRLRGVPRMHQRPIGDLIEAIQSISEGEINAESENSCPPVTIQSNGWQGSSLQVAGSVSSQYLSGLMMAAPLGNNAADAVSISVRGELVSRPYVEMTAEVMRAFHAKVEIPQITQGNETLVVRVNTDGYQGTDYDVEPDASAASYFWATAAITGGSVKVLGLTPKAIQGDVGFCSVLQKMGCEVTSEPDGMTVSGRASRGIDIDMNSISDTVQTLAVVALFADGPTRVRGVAHNRFKETDRIGDLACELRKLGATVNEHDDGMTIQAIPENLRGGVLETYHDHRMAMSLSLAGLKIPNVRILHPSCTAKTYPEYFADMENLLGRAHQWQQIEA